MLNAIPFFSNLSAGQLNSIGTHAAMRAYTKGEIILRKGDVSDSFFIIISGRVRVFMSDESGREVLLKILGEGDFFGEMAMLNDQPRSANVTAIEPCLIQIISFQALQQCIEKSPDIATKLMETLAKRLRDADRKISTLALMDISSRVSRTLLELAIVTNGKKIVGENLTQQDLANMIGASREMVNRTLKELTDQGYIEVQRKSITILNDQMPCHY